MNKTNCTVKNPFSLTRLFGTMSLTSGLRIYIINQGGGGVQPHFTSFYLIPILPFLAARMR